MEEEYLIEKEATENINASVHRSINKSDSSTPPTLPIDNSSFSGQDQQITINNSTIQRGVNEIYTPTTKDEVKELVDSNIIDAAQAQEFTLKYEAWNGPLEEGTNVISVKEEAEEEVQEETKSTEKAPPPTPVDEPEDTPPNPTEIDINTLLPTEEEKQPEARQLDPSSLVTEEEKEEERETKAPITSVIEEATTSEKVLPPTPVMPSVKPETLLVADETQEIEEKTEAEPKAPSPQEDPRFKEVTTDINEVSEKERTHDSTAHEVKEANEATPVPTNERRSKAESQQVDTMDQQEAQSFNADQFKSMLLDKIKSILPTNGDESEAFESKNEIDEVKTIAAEKVASEKKESGSAIESAAKTTPDVNNIPEVKEKPFSTPNTGKSPADLKTERAMPVTREDKEVNQPLQQNNQEVNTLFEDNKLTDEQLANSNEPTFLAALDSTQEAKTHSTEAPENFRLQEQTQLTNANTFANKEGLAQLSAMHENRKKQLSNVGGQQNATRQKNATERTKIASQINSIYDRTRNDVESLLGEIDGRVDAMFDSAANIAKAAFNKHINQAVDAYKEERYGGVIGKARWVKDCFSGLPDEVNKAYLDGREIYIDKMDSALNIIAQFVASKLNDAKARINQGKQEIAEYVQSLPSNLRDIGQAAANAIQSKFDALDSQVSDKQSSLIDNLADKYKESVTAIDGEIKAMKTANRGLIDIALDKVNGILETITKIKEELTKLINKSVDAIWAIIADPISFLGNLLEGVGQGFGNFLGNITEHLSSGLINWLTGSLDGTDIELPDDIFSLTGMFDLATQIMGINYDYIREKAVGVLGERTVSRLEKSFEALQAVKEEGMTGLWEYVKGEMSGLKDLVLGAIQDMITSTVMDAGIKWLLSLFTPAGAFVKAATMIIDLVKFFVENGERIFTVVEAVVNGISAIAAGNATQMAVFIEKALAQSVPALIDFFAKLLGLGDIAQKVQDIIGSVREKVDTAVDGFIEKAQFFWENRKGRKKKKKKGKNDETAAVEVKSDPETTETDEDSDATKKQEAAKDDKEPSKEKDAKENTGKEKDGFEADGTPTDKLLADQRVVNKAYAEIAAFIKKGKNSPIEITNFVAQTKANYKLSKVHVICSEQNGTAETWHVSLKLDHASKLANIDRTAAKEEAAILTDYNKEEDKKEQKPDTSAKVTVEEKADVEKDKTKQKVDADELVKSDKKEEEKEDEKEDEKEESLKDKFDSAMEERAKAAEEDEEKEEDTEKLTEALKSVYELFEKERLNNSQILIEMNAIQIDQGFDALEYFIAEATSSYNEWVVMATMGSADEQILRFEYKNVDA